MKIKRILNWVLSIVFLLAGVLSAFFSIVTGLFLALAGLLLLPPVGAAVRKKIQIPFMVRALVIEALICLSLVLYAPNAQAKKNNATEPEGSPPAAASQQSAVPSSTTVYQSAPSAKPSASAAAQPSVSLLSSTAKVLAGGDARMTVKGLPNTEYKMTVGYSAQSAASDLLANSTTDASGKVTFQWKVDKSIKSGIYPITISGGGQTRLFCITVT